MKIFVDSIGCRLNQSEMERCAWQFQVAGHQLVDHPGEADLVVINTCAVTAAAASDSRYKLRQAYHAGAAQIVVTGCWSTLFPEEAKALPGATTLIPNESKDQLVADLLKLPTEIFDLQPLERDQLLEEYLGFKPNQHAFTRLRTRSFIKAQDGCNNRCTFCITTLARGDSHSRTIPEVLAEIHYSKEDLALPDSSLNSSNLSPQEIVLTGVHLGSWGHDFSPPMSIQDLVTAILNETDIPRLRLSSLEPWDLDETFFKLWHNTRLCRQLHLPLQSGSASTLRRMARKTSPSAYAQLVHTARQAIPGVAVTTDVMVGFPGESEAEFRESLEFVTQMQFARVHVFTYSARPGTAAASMPDQVPHPLRKQRSTQMRQAVAQAEHAYRESFVGKILPVLWETSIACENQTWQLSGLTDNYLRVTAHANQPLWNQITPVRLLALDDDGLQGELVL